MPRYKLSLCHTPIKPDLLGFPGNWCLCVWVASPRDHEVHIIHYWKTNLLRHNFDVMHIEKNMFENIFNMIMDVKGKTKDNIKTRMDIALLGHESQSWISIRIYGWR